MEQQQVQPQAPIMDQGIVSAGVEQENPTQFAPAPIASLPTFVKPSFQQATTDQYGNVIPGHNAPLTKGGLLLKIIRGGLQGGMDAVAGGALNAPQHGESTFGEGVAAAQQMPLIRAARAQAIERGNLVNQEQRSNIALLPLRIAAQQMQLRNMQSEMEYRRAHAAYLNSVAGARDQMDLNHLYAQAVQNGDQEAAQKYADAITSIQRQPAAAHDNPFLDWRMANPKAPISSWFDIQNQSRAKYHVDSSERPQRVSPAQVNAAGVRMHTRLQKLEDRFQWNPAANLYIDTQSTRTLTPDEWDAEKQQIQDDYENELRTLGAEPEHYSYTGAKSNGAKPKRADATASAHNSKTGENAYLIGGKWYREAEVQ